MPCWVTMCRRVFWRVSRWISQYNDAETSLNDQLVDCTGVTFEMCRNELRDSPQRELYIARSPKCFAVSNKSDNPEIVFPSSSFHTNQPSTWIHIALSVLRNCIASLISRGKLEWCRSRFCGATLMAWAWTVETIFWLIASQILQNFLHRADTRNLI